MAGARGVPAAVTPEPKYYRLKRHLADLARTLPPGAALPTERSLAEDFGTSRTTVRQAVLELAVEGRLERVQGSGTFVARPKVAQRLRLSSYTQDTRAAGMEPTSRVLSVEHVRADASLAGRLGLSRGARAVHLERLRLADGEPMALEHTYLPAARFPGLARHVPQMGSLYDFLAQRYGVRPTDAEDTVETALATPYEAKVLGVDTGLPLLLVSRRAWDRGGVPVEWVRAVYRGDRYKLVAHLHAPRGRR
jgi:GntR family transcriptional regulator